MPRRQVTVKEACEVLQDDLSRRIQEVERERVDLYSTIRTINGLYKEANNETKQPESG